MRALIVAEEPERRELLAEEVRRAGYDVCGSSTAERVTAETWRMARAGLDAFVVDVGATAAMRRLIERARHAAEERIPVVLLLPESSTWLRGGPPLDLLPAVTLPARAADSGTLARALARMRVVAGPIGAPGNGEPHAPGSDAPSAALALVRGRRELRGPRGNAHVTPLETAILLTLMQEDGVVAHQQLAEELWGSALSDRHSRAAIRSHVYTLRRKLREVGFEGAIDSVPGVGYRFLAVADAAE